jgi:hypothetical protein
MNIDDADTLLQRVATIAIMYYPGLPADAPDYKLGDDIEWCVKDTAPGEVTDQLRTLIGHTVIDPTAYREALTEHVYALVPETSETE